MAATTLTCDRCGRQLDSGDPAWRVRIALTADPVQGLTETAGMSADRLDDHLNALLKRIELIPKEMLDAEVFQEFAFLICANCRGIVTANPLQQPLGLSGSD